MTTKSEGLAATFWSGDPEAREANKAKLEKEWERSVTERIHPRVKKYRDYLVSWRFWWMPLAIYAGAITVGVPDQWATIASWVCIWLCLEDPAGNS